MKRMGMVIKIKKEKIQEYKKLHKNAWPEILNTISNANIKNYTIFLREPENLLFGYWEYHGTNFEEDKKKIENDPKTQEWWKLTDPCQVPLKSKKNDEHWVTMEEVFHHP